jgi:pilus assembly protein CpaB
VTFEVTTDEAQRLTLGSSIGTLSLALRNIASSSVEQTRPITVADLGGGAMATELGNDLEKNKLPEAEKQVQIVEPKVEPVLPVEPKWVTVGVWNTTKREEHRVGLIQCYLCGLPRRGQPNEGG